MYLWLTSLYIGSIYLSIYLICSYEVVISLSLSLSLSLILSLYIYTDILIYNIYMYRCIYINAHSHTLSLSHTHTHTHTHTYIYIYIYIYICIRVWFKKGLWLSCAELELVIHFVLCTFSSHRLTFSARVSNHVVPEKKIFLLVSFNLWLCIFLSHAFCVKARCVGIHVCITIIICLSNYCQGDKI